MMLKSWKTLLLGIAAAIFAALEGASGNLTWKQAIPIAITAAIGVFAKDNNVTGGTK